MKKILFINHSNRLDGADTVLLKILSIVSPSQGKGCIYVVEPMTKKKSLFREAVKNIGIDECLMLPYKGFGGSLYRCIIVFLFNFYSIFRLVNLIKNRKIDIVVSNSSIVWIGIISAILTHVPHVWYFHESVRLFGYDKAMYIYRFFIRHSLNTVIFISNMQKKEWERLIKIDINNSHVIYNPIRNIKLSNEKYHSDKLVFGYLGSFSKIKNLPFLIKAFYMMKQECPDIVLLIAGSGEITEENIIKNLIKKYSLYHSIELLGQISDISVFYSTIDILVLPSKAETMPLVVIEAMSVKKVVIVTLNTAGLCELFEDKQDCIFFDPSNILELVNAMKAVMDKDHRTFLSSNGYKKVCQYNFNSIFEKSVNDLFK
jgi:glycosyltransferase involved in cell wall biosynthesis